MQSQSPNVLHLYIADIKLSVGVSRERKRSAVVA